MLTVFPNPSSRRNTFLRDASRVSSVLRNARSINRMAKTARSIGVLEPCAMPHKGISPRRTVCSPCSFSRRLVLAMRSSVAEITGRRTTLMRRRATAAFPNCRAEIGFAERAQWTISNSETIIQTKLRKSSTPDQYRAYAHHQEVLAKALRIRQRPLFTWQVDGADQSGGILRFHSD